MKLGFLKAVQPNSFSKLIPAACNFNNAQQVIGKIKQNELDCRDTAPLILTYFVNQALIEVAVVVKNLRVRSVHVQNNSSLVVVVVFLRQTKPI